MPDELRWWVLSATAILVLVGWLALLGRPWLPGQPLRLWNGDFRLIHNSQHLADGYSLLHLSFGALIFALTHQFNPALDRGRLALTIVASAVTWEALENLPSVIALFNPPVGHPSYGGDSIINALGDVIFAGTGFALAMQISRRMLWLMILGIEFASAALIRDGLVWGTMRLIGLL
ncbi:MAG: DUF2585 family protein [Pseudomonadota bacterium]|nr:DUF2585 family protein [Pseudomonadota bacterium]